MPAKARSGAGEGQVRNGTGGGPHAVQSLTRRTVSLTLVSVVARAPAFLIPVLIAAVFGAGHETDAYFLAYSAVLFLGGTLAQGIEQAVVPFAAQVIHRAAAPRHYLDRAAVRFVLVSAICWSLGIPVFLSVANSALRSAILGYVGTFTPLALLWCGAAVFTGALVSQWKIAAATGSMLWRGIGALVGIVAVPLGGGLWGVALGLGLGEVGRLWWTRRRLYAGLSESSELLPPPLAPLGRAAAAQVGASAAIGAAPVIERLLAVSLGVGAVSHLEYALRLLVVPSVVFEGGIIPLVLARWTQQIAAQNVPPARRDVLRVVAKGAGLALVIAVLLGVCAPVIVRILLVHGRFTHQDETAVSSLLRMLALAFVANMGAQLLERHYIASTRNWTLALLQLARAALRVGTMWRLLPVVGLTAFAIGFTVADWTYFLALLLCLRAPGSSVTQA